MIHLCLGNYTCVTDQLTATVLLVVTVPEKAETNPEGLKINASQDRYKQDSAVILLYSGLFFYSNKWNL